MRDFFVPFFIMIFVIEIVEMKIENIGKDPHVDPIHQLAVNVFAPSSMDFTFKEEPKTTNFISPELFKAHEESIIDQTEKLNAQKKALSTGSISPSLLSGEKEDYHLSSKETPTSTFESLSEQAASAEKKSYVLQKGEQKKKETVESDNQNEPNRNKKSKDGSEKIFGSRNERLSESSKDYSTEQKSESAKNNSTERKIESLKANSTEKNSNNNFSKLKLKSNDEQSHTRKIGSKAAGEKEISETVDIDETTKLKSGHDLNHTRKAGSKSSSKDMEVNEVNKISENYDLDPALSSLKRGSIFSNGRRKHQKKSESTKRSKSEDEIIWSQSLERFGNVPSLPISWFINESQASNRPVRYDTDIVKGRFDDFQIDAFKQTAIASAELDEQDKEIEFNVKPERSLRGPPMVV